MADARRLYDVTGQGTDDRLGASVGGLPELRFPARFLERRGVSLKEARGVSEAHTAPPRGSGPL
ncbi:MAG TPA: hypothetical protein VFP10_07335, partial [Candidatus Eisenbacteria bacterium]|nr:hypothetical protein [Candidatus Eisenbacteria bacterium]